MSQTTEIHFGPYRLLGRRGPLLRGGEQVHLQAKSLAVLWTLARQGGEVVPRRALQDAVWPGVVVGEEALTFQIQALRKALGDDPRSPTYVVTAHRVGFRLAFPEPAAPVAEPPKVLGPSFVGRNTELRLLQAALDRAAQGQRQLLFITGEPGIGKSELVDRFLRGAQAQSPQARVTRGQCVERSGLGEPYLPVLEALGRLVRQSPDEAPLRLLRRMAPSWLLQMPALLTPEDYAQLKRETAGVRQDRMLREMAETLDQLAADQLLVIAFEDLHWSDPHTVELITTLMRRRDPARLLILCTYRPVDAIIAAHPVRAAQQSLVAQRQAQELALGYLDQDEVAHYLRGRLNAGESSDDLEARVYARSAGHPLFLAQICDYLVQDGRALSLSAAELETELPQGLWDLIELQLSRLTLTEQLLLEVAAVAGGEFAAASVAGGAGIAAEQVERHCDALVRQAQFIDECGIAIWPDGTVSGRFRFRHALYEQVLRKRLSASRLAGLHRQIAEQLERAHGERAREMASELAEHFEKAGVLHKALQYCVHTARNALERVASDAVRQQTQRGLALLHVLPDGAERDAAELALNLIAGVMLQVEHGYHTREAAPHLERVEALIDRVDDAVLIEPAAGALWTAHHFKPNLPAALLAADRVRELGQRLRKPGLECCGHAWASLSLHIAGRHREALDRANAALVPDLALASREGSGMLMSAACGALASKAILQWMLGLVDSAQRTAQDALRCAERSSNPYNRCLVIVAAAVSIPVMSRDWEAVVHAADQLLPFAQKHLHHDSIAWARRQRGLALCYLGRADEGLPVVREITAAQIKAGYFLNLVLDLCVEGEWCVEQRRLEEAQSALATARWVLESQGMRAQESTLERLEARLLLAQDPGAVDAARGKIETAIAIACERGTLSLELRAAMNLAELHRDQQQPERAVAVLAPVLARFTEGFDTTEFRGASVLVAQLQAGLA